MVRSSGVKLVSWIARYSTSTLANNLYKGAARPSIRDFTYKPSTRIVEDALYGRGLFGTNLRAIHSTAFLCKDYYEILGVDPNATPSDLKKAFHALAKKHHPDLNKDDPDADKKFQEINKAYEVLKDEQERASYDQLGHDAFERSKGGDPGGFNPFEDIFPGGFNPFDFSSASSRYHDVKVSLELSFMEAVQGCMKTLKYQTTLPCEACGGTGVPPGSKPETCKLCRGKGMTYMQKGPFSVQSTCLKCGGAGKIFTSHCRSCYGNRVVSGSKSVRLDVSAGVDNGEIIKVSRSGGADPDGYEPGDLYVTIKVKEDPVFRREGSHIHVDSVLSVSQAMLGGTVQVPTLTGDVVLKVRPGTQPGQKVVLKKKGIKSRGSFSFGDQYVHFNVSIPMNLTPRQRELMEEFAKEERGEYEPQAAVASG